MQEFLGPALEPGLRLSGPARGIARRWANPRSRAGTLVRLASITRVRVTQKGQVTIPLEVRRALGISPGTEVRFELDAGTARLVPDRDQAATEIARIRGAGDVDLSTDEILALTRK